LAVENLSLEEPDAPLFEVPPGYEVLNEVESFRIGWR
jgi:hypothetical protein